MLKSARNVETLAALTSLTVHFVSTRQEIFMISGRLLLYLSAESLNLWSLLPGQASAHFHIKKYFLGLYVAMIRLNLPIVTGQPTMR